MVTFHINPAELAVFLGILLRLSVMVFLLPIFSNTQVPAAFKACATIALTAMLYPILRKGVLPLQLDLLSLFSVILGEVIFGILFALSTAFIFAAFQMAGELISFEMGFGFAQVADPQNGAQTAIISMWFQLLAVLVLFSLNGHHILLSTIVQSFQTVPLGAFSLDPSLHKSITVLSGNLFLIAIKMAAPVMIVLLLAQFGLGLMAKFAPQINILMTSFPITIILGILFMVFSLSIWGSSMEHSFSDLFNFLQHLIVRK